MDGDYCDCGQHFDEHDGELCNMRRDARESRCTACAGVGKIEELGVSGPIGSKTCDVCGGSGRKATPMRSA